MGRLFHARDPSKRGAHGNAARRGVSNTGPHQTQAEAAFPMVGRAGSAVALFLVLFGPSFAAEKQVPASADQVQLSFAPVVKRVAPAVVNVYASRTVAAQASPFFSDPFFRQFFSGGQANGARVQRALGSGVVIDPSGLIVTN